MAYKIESSQHYFFILRKILNQKGFEVTDLMTVAEVVYRYYEFENLLMRCGFNSPTYMLRKNLEDLEEIDDIVSVLSDFLKMSSELEIFLKDPEKAMSNYKLEYMKHYLLSEHLQQARIDWSNVYDYNEEFIRVTNYLSNKCGVYFLLTEHDEVIYIGKSKNLGKRLFTSIAERSNYGPEKATALVTKTLADAHVLEPFFISKFKPIANTEFNDAGDVTFSIIKNGKEITTDRVFKTAIIEIYKKGARENEHV